jgi:glycerol-3-phosphate cytidylyltransferase
MRCYVGGTFDLFHSGHVELLKRAAEYGKVWVALNTDQYAAEFKKRPIMNYLEREAVLLACRYVDWVVPNFGEEDFILETIEPRYIVYANDGTYTRKSYLDRLKIDENWLLDHDAELVFLDYSEGVSSTDIVARITGRHRADGVQAREHAATDASCPCLVDTEAGGVLGGVRDGGGCPCR